MDHVENTVSQVWPQVKWTFRVPRNRFGKNHAIRYDDNRVQKPIQKQFNIFTWNEKRKNANDVLIRHSRNLSFCGFRIK